MAAPNRARDGVAGTPGVSEVTHRRGSAMLLPATHAAHTAPKHAFIPVVAHVRASDAVTLAVTR